MTALARTSNTAALLASCAALMASTSQCVGERPYFPENAAGGSEQGARGGSAGAPQHPAGGSNAAGTSVGGSIGGASSSGISRGGGTNGGTSSGTSGGTSSGTSGGTSSGTSGGTSSGTSGGTSSGGTSTSFEPTGGRAFGASGSGGTIVAGASSTSHAGNAGTAGSGIAGASSTSHAGNAGTAGSGVAGASSTSYAGSAGNAGTAGSGVAGAAGRCDPRQAFVSMRSLDELNTASNEDAPRLTPEQLTIYFTRQSSNGPFQVISASRGTTLEPFSGEAALPLHPDSSGPSVTANGMRLYYSSDLADPSGSPDLYVSIAPFSSGNSRPLSALNTMAWEYAPYVSVDERELLYVVRDDGLAFDEIWVARRETGDFGNQEPVPGINLPDTNNRSPVLSSDGLTLYFASDRPSTIGKMDIFVATRQSRTEPFTNPLPIVELNTAASEQPDWIAPDECTLYFRSDRPLGAGGRDIWVASRR